MVITITREYIKGKNVNFKFLFEHKTLIDIGLAKFCLFVCSCAVVFLVAFVFCVGGFNILKWYATYSILDLTQSPIRPPKIKKIKKKFSPVSKLRTSLTFVHALTTLAD